MLESVVHQDDVELVVEVSKVTYKKAATLRQARGDRCGILVDSNSGHAHTRSVRDYITSAASDVKESAARSQARGCRSQSQGIAAAILGNPGRRMSFTCGVLL
jgi:hypothetical protein